ncbi:MAG: SCO1664 family protein [Angustibacter sp.]
MLHLLRHGELSVSGRMVSASNATLFGTVRDASTTAPCIYKPVSGERPLWDFPRHTLGRREVAAYQVSHATGWDVVPPTVWRDGPFGVGSVQWWIEADHTAPALVDVVSVDQVPAGWLPVLHARDSTGDEVVLVHADDARLARMAVFDAMVDNADRKAGHVLLAGDGHLWGVDHGLSFNVVDKLRTVLWGWHGRPLPPDCLEVVAALIEDLKPAGPLASSLAESLTEEEVARTRERAQRLAGSGSFPGPDPSGPVIPWPPF